MTSTGRWLPTLLISANLLGWLALIAATPPLPHDYFDHIDARVHVTAAGTTFDLTTDNDPLVVVAERPFGRPFRNDGLVYLALIASLPATAVAEGTLQLVPVAPAVGGIGSLAASWLFTATFAITSSAQWWLIGCAASAFFRRPRRPVTSPDA